MTWFRGWRTRNAVAAAAPCTVQQTSDHAAVRMRRSVERGAAEADLVAVGVAVDHLAHAVPARLLRGGLDSSGADALDPLIEVVDEHRVQCIAGALGQLLDVEVPVLGKFPDRLRRVREETRVRSPAVARTT